MIFEGTQLARAMLSIHAIEMEQATRCASWRSAARIERHIARQLHRGGNQALCRLGCLLEEIGHRLHEYGVSQALPLGSKATQRG